MDYLVGYLESGKNYTTVWVMASQIKRETVVKFGYRKISFPNSGIHVFAQS